MAALGKIDAEAKDASQAKKMVMELSAHSTDKEKALRKKRDTAFGQPLSGRYAVAPPSSKSLRLWRALEEKRSKQTLKPGKKAGKGGQRKSKAVRKKCKRSSKTPWNTTFVNPEATKSLKSCKLCKEEVEKMHEIIFDLRVAGRGH